MLEGIAVPILLFLIFWSVKDIPGLLGAILDEMRKGKDKDGQPLPSEEAPPLLMDRLEPKGRPRDPSEF